MLEIDWERTIWADRQVSSRDVEAAPINVILGRFVDEAGREKREAALDRAIAFGISVSGESLRFQTSTLPPKKESGRERNFLEILNPEFPTCDNYGLILFGAFLTGRTTPFDKQKFDEAFCGRVIRREDTIGKFGPLSGHKGANLEPFSRCWLAATELRALVLFMKEPSEELPKFPGLDQGPPLPEDEQRVLLVERDKIRHRNDQKGAVIVTWCDLLKKFSEILGDETLRLTSGEESGDGKELTRFVFDPSLQFKIGGEEYRKVVGWVEKEVLEPLVKLVGEGNFFSDKDGKSQLFSSYKETADNCPNAPEASSVGAVSLVE